MQSFIRLASVVAEIAKEVPSYKAFLASAESGYIEKTTPLSLELQSPNFTQKYTRSKAIRKNYNDPIISIIASL